MDSPLKQTVLQAVEANQDIRPTQLLLEMERAIRAMHAKEYGADGIATAVADLILCVVDPEIRERAIAT